MLKGDAAKPPIAQLTGFKLTPVTSGPAGIELQAGEQHSATKGIRRGGAFCDLADAAMGIAYASSLEEGETRATLDLKINCLKPIWQASCVL
ncbi:MAG: PaaI family thioesterase [Methylocella sp.]